MGGSEDEGLVHRCLAGDSAAFDEIVRRYRDRVFSLAFRMLGEAMWAEDLTQEAFLRAYTRLVLYDPSRPFGTWLLNLMARLCLNALRDHRTQARYLEGKGWHPVPESVEEQLYERERNRTLQRLLLRLPPDQRAVTLLRYYEGYEVKEIAEAMDVPIGTVKTWLFRARESLRQWLKEEGWEG